MNQIVVDAGQNGVRIKLFSDDQGVLCHGFSGLRSDSDVLVQLAENINEVLQDPVVSLSFSADATWTVAVGSTGLTSSHGDARALLLRLPEAVVQVHLAHDSVTSYLGALSDEFGAVIAAGTGVVTLACAPHTCARVDGWGHLLGDAGSGFWIGSRGLQSALEAHDGRGPTTSLLDAVTARFGAIAELPSQVHQDPRRVSLIASFCIDVVNCAEAGDHVAGKIIDKAARELTRSATAALSAVGLPLEQAFVSSAGNVIGESPFVRAALSTTLERAGVLRGLTTPRATTLEGTRALLSLDPTHPLFAETSRSDRNRR